MELSNSDVYGALEPLREICQKDFPVTISLDLVKMSQALTPVYQAVDAIRNKLIEKHGTNEEGSSLFEVKPDAPTFDKFISEIEELMGQKVELNVEKITLPAITDGRPFEVSAKNLMLLEKFIDIA